MKIGIIGLGWLGLPLAKSLLSKGHQVIGTTRTRPVELTHERFSHIRFDPSEKKRGNPGYFEELEAVVLAFTPSREDHRAYAHDCMRVIDLLSPSCKVLLISSTSVYPQQDGLYTEADYPAGSFQGNSISYGELTAQSVLRDRLTILRMSGLVGPNRYPVTAMAKSGKTYQAIEPVNLIHLEDAIGLTEYVLEKKLWGKTINGCATNHPLKGDFYTRMASKLGINPPVFEKSIPSERIISNAYSLELGYRYVYPDPDHFPVA